MRIATTLLASCALMVSVSVPSATPQPHCTGTCELTIIVPAGCGSGIQVAPNPVRIGGGSEPTTMKWVLRTKGWKFDSNGIQFDAPAGLFDAKNPPVDPKAPPVDPPVFTVVNKHTSKAPAKGLFKYDINLVSADGKCKHDPTVINQ